MLLVVSFSFHFLLGLYCILIDINLIFGYEKNKAITRKGISKKEFYCLLIFFLLLVTVKEDYMRRTLAKLQKEKGQDSFNSNFLFGKVRFHSFTPKYKRKVT